jgi:S-DNA-T family DNA segregation ATPase FtsK/SpoIIIE
MAVALLVSTPAPVTQQVREILRQCFGAGALLFPCGLALFGLTFFADQYGLFPAHIAAGLGLIGVAVLSLMSLSWPGAEQQPHLVLEQEVLLARGGYVGGGVAWALLSSVGFAVGTVVLIALIVVGCIICGFSISGFVMRVRNRAAVAGAELQASRERRFEERQQRKREQQAARAERPNRT